MPQKTNAANVQRLSRDEWLARALEALAKEGSSVLTVDALVKRLGVSRGSFYWHFKDRTDFIRQLVEYWSEVDTKGVAEETSRLGVSAEQRLLTLAERIVTGRFNRYDMPIRAWASHDPVAARMVKKVDEFRLGYVRSLFAEIGFTSEQLEMRTRTFVLCYSLEHGLFAEISRKERLKQLKLRHALLTRP